VIAVVAAVASLASGCGEFIRNDRSPVTIRVEQLLAGEGGNPNVFANTLRSDVRTNGAIFDDMGRAIMTIIMKDPGTASATTTPTELNSVTITRYRVSFRRSDGRNVPGVDVPFPFESAMTVTIIGASSQSANFELIRHTSKAEAPLAALAGSFVIISTIADVTFYGRDQVGNNVQATASIGVLFGDFADPS
jgi:hypothetical protein